LIRTRGADAAFVAALGALHSLAFAWSGAWWLQPLAAGVFAWRIGAAGSPRRAALLGWLFGTAWLGAGIWWLFVSMHRYGGLPAWLSAAAVAALCGVLALYLALAMALFALLRRGTPLADALLFAALWLAAELARGLIFTGFPWLASGYAHVDSPLAVLAPWVGVYGIGAVAAFAAAAAAFAAPAQAPRRAAAALLVTAAGVGALGWAGRDGFTAPAGRVGVTLLQTNVAQDEKFAVERLPAALDALARAIASARGPLVMAPETAIPLLPAQLDAGWRDALFAPFRGDARALLVGAPLGSYEDGYTNSAVGVAGAGEHRYDKHHLVPFGEFIPPGFRWFVDLMRMPLGDFARGPLAAPSFVALGQRIAPNICYEDLFGEELAARFRDPATAPTLFANLSNIGWFGDTIALPQHLNISRMRALEFERPMLRATNTGVTAAIDHRGAVTHALPPFTVGALDAEVEGRSGLTPYAQWAAVYGARPLAACALLWVLLAARRRRR
jgi:apolipoprotein N-acyltransferase